MFKASDRVNYDRIKLNNKTRDESTSGPYQPMSLVNAACIELLWNEDRLGESMAVLPRHLIPRLLHTALKCNHVAVSTIVANWPFPTLRFSEVLYDPTEEFDSLALMGQLFTVYDGLTFRTTHCKLTRLDFRNMEIDPPYIRWVVQMWPLLSLKRFQLRPANLTKIIQTEADKLGVDVSMSDIKNILTERLNHNQFRNCVNAIKLPRDGRLEVVLDSIHFSLCGSLHQDFLIANCLRHYTPVYITIPKLSIMYDQINDWETHANIEIPAQVLRSQQVEVLTGLEMKQLDEKMLMGLVDDVCRFPDLYSLDLQDCNIYMKAGITRSRTAFRHRLCTMFSAFSHLHRLDLSYNYLTGCLGELLEALNMPLEFLSLRGCDLKEEDLVNLSESKHAGSLRELNISKLCQFPVMETDRISPNCPLNIIKCFPKMAILNIAQNNLESSAMKEFGESLCSHMHCLKGLDISGNILTFDSQLDLARCCTRVPSMQWLRLTFTSTALDEVGIGVNHAPVNDMLQKLTSTMKACGREDICIDAVRVSFAILVDLIDFFD